MPRKAKDITENTNLEEVKTEAIRKKTAVSKKEDTPKKGVKKVTSSKETKSTNTTNSKKVATSKQTSASTIKKRVPLVVADSMASTLEVPSNVSKKASKNVTAASSTTPSKNKPKNTKTKKEDTIVKTSSSKKASKSTKSEASLKKTKTAKTAKKKASPASMKKSSTSSKVKTKNKEDFHKIEVLEYYDLPYRYNQTVVKVLAQTPNTLFVYWDISDTDRQKYIDTYGEYFFHNTKPVLIVHNLTMHYAFELDIHDFANCWYLQVRDSKCDYQIELGRRPINQYVSIPNAYLYVSSSNSIESPNDHILADSLKPKVTFRNVKSHQLVQKDIKTLPVFDKITKLLSLPDFYQKLYKEASFTLNQFDFKNPSSGNPTSTFK